MVRLPDALLGAALLALVAAAALALAADYPPAEARLNWRYPGLVIAVALTNTALTVLLVLRPDPATGAVLLIGRDPVDLRRAPPSPHRGSTRATTPSTATVT